MRKLMWFTLGFGAACAFGAYLYVPWLLNLAAVLLAISVVGLLMMRFWRPLRIAAAVILGAAVGLLWFSAYDGAYLLNARALDGKTQDLTVTVSDFSYETSYGCAFDGTVSLGGRTYAVRAYLNSLEELSPGDILSGRFSLRLTTNGGAEDPTYHQGKGIFLIAYQKGDLDELVEEDPSWKDQPAIWRQKLITILENTFPEDAAGFAKALLLGDRTDIDYETNTAFKVSGIMHIIAVSGLHVSILFGLIQLLTGRRRVLTSIIGIPVVLFFTAVVGFTPSVTRAAIMQILVMLALLFDREYDPFTALSFAALVILVINPLSITSVSFQLSFGCMVGIFQFSEKIRSWLLHDNRLGKLPGRFARWFGGSVAITLSAMVYTTPLVAIYFGAVSLVGVLTNLLVLWVVTYVFYGVMLVCVLGCISMSAAGSLGWLIAWPIRYILQVAKGLSSLPLAAVYTESIYTVFWLVFCYGLLAVFLFMKQRRPAIFVIAAVLSLCLCLACGWSEPYLDACRVTVLDVGQGQAVLLQSDGKTFLVDCGGSYDADVADKTAETLLSQGIVCLDGIIVSHFDGDHVNGLQYLLTRIDTKLLMLPFVEDPEGVGRKLEEMCPEETLWVREDLVFSFQDTNFTVFAPVSYKSGNESSMCVLYRTKNCAILITGDRGEQTEKILLQRHGIGKLDVLVVGHHGAKTSTCEELLAATMPEYALISVGANNRYGHPAEPVLARLEKYNCKILRTDLYGTVIIRR